MEIYERLRQARLARKITQKEAAMELHTTRQQIGKYENGTQEMTASKLKAICELYDISSDEILDLKKPKKL